MRFSPSAAWMTGLVAASLALPAAADVVFMNNTGKTATDFHFTVDVTRLGGRKLPTSIPWGDPWQVDDNGTGYDVTYSWEKIRLTAPLSDPIVVPDGSSLTLVGVKFSEVFGANAVYSNFTWTPTGKPATPSVPEPGTVVMAVCGLLVAKRMRARASS